MAEAGRKRDERRAGNIEVKSEVSYMVSLKVKLTKRLHACPHLSSLLWVVIWQTNT